MTTRTISICIDSELLAAIEGRNAKASHGRSEVIGRIVRRYLGVVQDRGLGDVLDDDNVAPLAGIVGAHGCPRLMALEIADAKKSIDPVANAVGRMDYAGKVALLDAIECLWAAEAKAQRAAAKEVA